MAASLGSFFLSHCTLSCAFLLLLLLPSPSCMHTFTLTNPHILHLPLDDFSPLNVAASYSQLAPADGEMHADGQPPSVEVSMARPYIHETVAASFGLSAKSLLHDNAPQADHSYLLDDGVKSLETRPLGMTKPLVSRPDGAGNIQDDGTPKDVTMQHVAHENADALQGALDHKAEDGGGKHSGPKLKMHVESVDVYLRENAPQGDLAFLVNDGALPEDATVESPAAEKDTNMLPKNVPQGEFSYLLDDGSNRKHVPPDGGREKDIDGFAMDHNLMSDRIQQRSESSGDLRTVVDDDRHAASWRRGNGGWGGRLRRGRSATCTANPGVCVQQLAGAEQYIQIRSLSSNIIRSYIDVGQPAPNPKHPACCSGTCVDLNTDTANCGSCGRQCSLTQGCCAGMCVDLNRDMSNCGRCSNACPPVSPCQYGICGYY